MNKNSLLAYLDSLFIVHSVEKSNLLIGKLVYSGYNFNLFVVAVKDDKYFDELIIGIVYGSKHKLYLF